MLAAHIAGGGKFEDATIQTPLALNELLQSRNDLELARDMLAFYFAHVIAATEDFIRNDSDSPWGDFDFSPGNPDDFLIFQLGVPTGLLADGGQTERKGSFARLLLRAMNSDRKSTQKWRQAYRIPRGQRTSMRR
jgi:hypothetical protein